MFLLKAAPTGSAAVETFRWDAASLARFVDACVIPTVTKLAQHRRLGKRKIEWKSIYSAPLNHRVVSWVAPAQSGATLAGGDVRLLAHMAVDA
jgi:hypothetical protein